MQRPTSVYVRGTPPALAGLASAVFLRPSLASSGTEGRLEGGNAGEIVYDALSSSLRTAILPIGATSLICPGSTM